MKKLRTIVLFIGGYIFLTYLYATFFSAANMHGDFDSLSNRHAGFFVDDKPSDASFRNVNLESRLAVLEVRLKASDERYEKLLNAFETLSGFVEEVKSGSLVASGQLYNEPYIEPIDDEQQLRDEGRAFDNNFLNLQHTVLGEIVDESWQIEMAQSLQEVEQRLRDFELNSTRLVSQDCRSTACVVEFTHTNENDKSLLPRLLAARAASSVMVKQLSEGGQDKTVAIYQRDL